MITFATENRITSVSIATVVIVFIFVIESCLFYISSVLTAGTFTSFVSIPTNSGAGGSLCSVLLGIVTESCLFYISSVLTAGTLTGFVSIPTNSGAGGSLCSVLLGIVTESCLFNIGCIVATRAGFISIPTDSGTSGSLCVVVYFVMTKSVDYFACVNGFATIRANSFTGVACGCAGSGNSTLNSGVGVFASGFATFRALYKFVNGDICLTGSIAREKGRGVCGIIFQPVACVGTLSYDCSCTISCNGNGPTAVFVQGGLGLQMVGARACRIEISGTAIERECSVKQSCFKNQDLNIVTKRDCVSVFRNRSYISVVALLVCTQSNIVVFGYDNDFVTSLKFGTIGYQFPNFFLRFGSGSCSTGSGSSFGGSGLLGTGCSTGSGGLFGSGGFFGGSCATGSGGFFRLGNIGIGSTGSGFFRIVSFGSRSAFLENGSAFLRRRFFGFLCDLIELIQLFPPCKLVCYTAARCHRQQEHEG